MATLQGKACCLLSRTAACISMFEQTGPAFQDEVYSFLAKTAASVSTLKQTSLIQRRFSDDAIVLFKPCAQSLAKIRPIYPENRHVQA